VSCDGHRSKGKTVLAGGTGFSVGVVQLMTATAEEVPGADLNDSNRMAETVAYEPKPPSESGPDGPMGSSDMSKANLTSQAHGRYIFGSGARPLEAIRSSGPSAAGDSARSTMRRPIPVRKLHSNSSFAISTSRSAE
jgi:hypothetical protein